MAGTSPTQRTLKYLRDRGYVVAVTERWNPFAKIRQDLFGFIDLVAVRDKEIVGIQCTSRDNISARVQKIMENKDAIVWSEAGGAIYVIGWGKVGPRGEKKAWSPRIVGLEYLGGEWWSNDHAL